MFHKGATAVENMMDEGFAVAVRNEGLYKYSPAGDWRSLLKTRERIRSIATYGGIIFGGGDRGLIMRSMDNGRTWTSAILPTNAAIWSIAVSKEGMVAAHGKHTVYFSSDFGSSWSSYPIFAHLEDKPVIRSLCFYSGFLLAGTQIHDVNGGIWIADLLSRETMLLKEETKAMVSSMLVVEDSFLLAAKGSAHGGRGAIEMLPLTGRYRNPHSFSSRVQEASFLNISLDEGVIYTTSSQDEFGYSRIYKIDLCEKKLILSDTIKGHGFGIANRKEEFFVSALYESKYVQSSETTGYVH
ncbi:exo-alpha-sialidase [Metabacillus sp. 84]|uniref:exo-alpha-sialidase n=1 Tax=Metabacillus sp. 84 TaxID=3404705 RepID=UPI003CEC0C3D